ncbi:pyridoxal phosphate-dependent aminotransferase [Clostridium sp.]
MSRFLSKASESLLPYTPGEQPQGRKFIKLNTNECPYPPSPKVAEAILAGYEEIAAGCGTAGAADMAEQAETAGCGCNAGATEAGKMAEKAARVMPPELANLRLYSDPEERVLIEAIADHYGVGTNQVIAGNGSDEILGFAFRAFCDQNAPLQFADLTYGFYPALCGLYGIPFKAVPLEEDFTLNIEPYKNCGNNVIIANPNAPTGMSLPLSAIEEVAASNPDRVVMVDEAYVDFGGESCVSLLPKYENLVIIQTFSKSRSLAGARVGFAIANPDLIADMNRIKYSFNPYNVNRLSILAGAAAMRDWDYTKECTGRICKTREKTTEALRALGFTVLDSKTNFIFAKSGDMPGKVYFDGLREAGILVRRWDSERIKDYVRISIGSEEEMETFVEETKKLVEAARSAAES